MKKFGYALVLTTAFGFASAATAADLPTVGGPVNALNPSVETNSAGMSSAGGSSSATSAANAGNMPTVGGPVNALNPSSSDSAANTVIVGGQSMFPTKDIVDNAVNSADHTTLVAAVKAAGLVETLKGKGPFTVFAPTNAAFGKLPAGTVDSLVKPENKATLTKVLTYHVVPGKYDFVVISNAIKKNKGKAEIPTASGGKLTAVMNGKQNIQVKDEAGNTANISTYDVYQSNGVIHVVDTVLMPK